MLASTFLGMHAAWGSLLCSAKPFSSLIALKLKNKKQTNRRGKTKNFKEPGVISRKKTLKLKLQGTGYPGSADCI